MSLAKPEYLQKALLLSENEQLRVLSRMTGKLPARLRKDKLTVDEAIALQLEIEEDLLEEWRKNWYTIRKNYDRTETSRP